MCCLSVRWVLVSALVCLRCFALFACLVYLVCVVCACVFVCLGVFVFVCVVLCFVCLCLSDCV